MSFMRASAGGATNVKPDYTGLQIQTSVSTLPIPIVYGAAKLAPNIIWYADFKAQGQSSGVGGKGGGSPPTSYAYSASIILALCEGPVEGIGQIWKGTDLYTLSQLGFSFLTGTTPQAPWSYLGSAHGDQALGYQGTALLAEANYALGDTPDLSNHNFEVYGPLKGTGTNGVDADPAQCIQDFLTNGQYGVGLPAAAIDQGSLFSGSAAAGTGDASLQTYCKALGICFSPCLATQETAQSVLQRWLQLTNTAAVWSGTMLKFIPYGDLPVTGNGVTYRPDVTPVYDLDDDDFQGDSDDDPVQIQRSDVTDAHNVQRLEVADRTNAYNYTPIESRDESMVNLYGLRVGSTVTAHEICDTAIAATVGQLILQRGLYVRNTYTFKLSWEYCLLEPMDLVTLTDPGLGLAKTPVRLTSIEEDENGLLTVQAEEFPSGIATATQYPKQARASVPVNRNVPADPVNPPVIFEPSASLTNGIAQVWIAASGGSGGAADPNWGGANVWISPDNETYQQIGQIIAPARQGVLTSGLPAPAVNPDTASILAVDLTESAGVLANATQADAAAARTLCWVDGELVAYATATLTAASKYNLSYLERGLYDSTAVAHGPGAPFVRLDTAIFEYDLPAAYVGQPIWIKLQSYNVFGGGVQDIAAVEAYPLTPTGTGFFVAPPTDVVISSTARTQGDGSHLLSLVVTWQPSAGPLLDHYEVQYQVQGASAWLGATVGADQTDWVLVGAQANITYEARVRAVSTVGNASAWTNAAATGSGALSSTAPVAPSGLAATGGTEEITLTWAPNPEPDILGYRVLAAHGHDAAVSDASVIAEGISGTYFTFADPGAYGDTWSFWLEAVNVAGFSEPAGPVFGTTSFEIPAEAIGEAAISQSKLVPALQQGFAALDPSIFAQINALDPVSGAWAQISLVQTTVEQANYAQAQQTLQLGASVTSNFAAYQQTLTAQAGINTATVSALEELTSTVGGNTTSIETLTSTVDGVTAQYNLKIQADVNGHLYAGGFGLMSSPDGSGGISMDAVFLVTSFTIAQLNGDGTISPVSPFTVSGGRVVMQDALINSVSANKITSGAITTANLVIQPAPGSGGGLTLYNQGGAKILDSATGLWPGAATRFITLSGGSGTQNSNAGSPSSGTIYSGSFTTTGTKIRLEIGIPITTSATAGGIATYGISVTVDGASATPVVVLGAGGGSANPNYVPSPSYFAVLFEALSAGTHTITISVSVGTNCSVAWAGTSVAIIDFQA